MSFDYEREYEVQLLLGDPSTPPLWHAETWQEVFPILRSVAKHARGVPITSSLQFEGAKNRSVQFGRIGWNDKGHAKWTHQIDTPYRFLNMEVWAPSRCACTKDGLPPDFLFILWNQGFFTQDSSFRDTVLLAVPANDATFVEACSKAAGQLAKIMQAKFHGRMTRPWARHFVNVFTDALGDMPTTGLFRLGDVGHQSPGNEILEEQWKPVQPR